MTDKLKHLDFAKRLTSLMDSKRLSIQDVSDRTKINFDFLPSLK